MNAPIHSLLPQRRPEDLALRLDGGQTPGLDPATRRELEAAARAVTGAEVDSLVTQEGLDTVQPTNHSVSDAEFRSLLQQDSWNRAQATQLQTGLVERGHDLGNYGPNGDGVDGQVGPATRSAVTQARAALPPAPAQPQAAAEPSYQVSDARFGELLEQDSWTRPEARELQTGLVERGHDLGNYGPNGDGVDGHAGPATRAAVEQERAAAAEAPARPTAAATAEAVDGAAAALGVEQSEPLQVSGERFTQLIGQESWSRDEAIALQTGLNERGYDVGEPDGVVGTNTRAGLEAARARVATPAMADGAPQPERPGDAWVVVYPDYEISLPDEVQELTGQEKASLGHTDLVTFEDAPGGSRRATLHQFGRYNGDHGEVRTHQLPLDLDVDPATGDLTAESRNALLSHLSEHHGRGTRVEVTEVENVDLDRVDQFVDDFRAESEAGGRAYSIAENNCTTFAWEAAHAGTVDPAERESLEGRGRYSVPGMSNWFMGDFTHHEYVPGGEVATRSPEPAAPSVPAPELPHPQQALDAVGRVIHGQEPGAQDALVEALGGQDGVREAMDRVVERSALPNTTRWAADLAATELTTAEPTDRPVDPQRVQENLDTLRNAAGMYLFSDRREVRAHKEAINQVLVNATPQELQAMMEADPRIGEDLVRTFRMTDMAYAQMVGGYFGNEDMVNHWVNDTPDVGRNDYAIIMNPQ